MRISLLLVISLIAIIGTVQAWTGFNSVVSRLVDYQTPTGGFRGVDGKPSIEATSNALLLASLYDLRSKINVTEVPKFITSVENKDGGYAPTPGAPSDVEAVRNALLSLQHLGGKPSNPTNILNYIKSLIDKNTHLFAIRSGEKGSVKGTALALESLELLGELNQKWVQDEFPKIKEYLTKHRSSGDVLYFNFPEDTTVSQVTANYYGIIVAKYVGFDFGDASKWAKYITGLQSATGQFYDNAEKKVTSLASTAHALHALNTLGGLKGATERFVDSVNVDNLKKGVRHIADDVTAAAHAHSAIALTKAFKDFFRTVVNYEGGAEEGLIEGSNLKPSLAITSLFDERTSFPHGDFDVSTQTTFHGKEATKGKLTWDQELQRYVGEHLPTVGNLGPVKLGFNLVHKVAGLGELAFEVLETKSVGYGLTVVPKVQQDGREIREGESVSVGTDFKFNVALSTRANENLQTGDFIVNFNVLDSSNVVIHQDKVDGASNKGPITFSYKLSNAAVPTGKLTFRVDVATKGLISPHTTRSVQYYYSSPLIATNIQFAGVAKGQAPSFKLGETVKVTTEPASFPDLRTPHVLPAEGADKRNFFLDIKSPQGVLIRTVPGTATKGSSKYTFETTVEPVLESIGTNVLSFRYLPAEGEEVTLQNYDSATGELYEDIHVLSYTVKAELALADVTGPAEGNLYYGGNVEYKFRIKDNLSGQHVTVSDKALANVFLDLQHEEAGGRPYTSVHHPATVTGQGKNKAFSVDWTVNPNVVKGAGSILLSVLDVDGTAIPIKGAKPIKVNVGGDISVEPHTYTTAITTARQTAIVAEFGLSTRNKTLKDAELSATLVRVSDGASVAALPVAHHNGRYTVSWTAAHKVVPSGQYKLLFYRDIDRIRAQEKREQREKRERKEKQLRGDTTTTTTANEEAALQPLFVIDVDYSAPKFTSLPVRAEFLAFVSLSAFLVWLTLKRTDPK